jgi:hypothetical protein
MGENEKFHRENRIDNEQTRANKNREKKDRKADKL